MTETSDILDTSMQTPNSTLSSTSMASSSPGSVEARLQNPNSNLKPQFSSVSRLWRPQAQRILRNQWPKLVTHRQKWSLASSSGRSHATSLVNAYLSERYMPWMDLGVLSDMPNIRQKASLKLVRQQELYRKKLLSSYKDMVGVVSHMLSDSRSMRCFMKTPAGSPLVQFSSHAEDKDDLGDGSGIPVFTFWSIPYHETLAQELVRMFASELVLKRLLVLELCSLSCEEQKADKLCWANELYPGEFVDLRSVGMYSEETCQPVLPNMYDCKSEYQVGQNTNQPSQEVLQVYLTTWYVEVNVDTCRIEEIFSIVGEEMHVNLS